MKRYIVIIAMALLCVATAVSCKKDSGETVIKSSIVGDWHLATYNGQKTDNFDIYMRLGSNGQFVIYQHLSTLGYERLTGTYSVTSTTLTGVYDDGVEWNGVYEYTLSSDGNTLTTVLKGEHSTETSVYVRTEIPADLPVLDGSRSEVAGYTGFRAL